MNPTLEADQTTRRAQVVQASAADRYLTQVNPEGTADIVVDLHDPGWPVIRRMDPAVAARHGRLLREDDLLAPDPLRRLLQRTGWWLARYDDGPDRFVAVAERVSP